MAEYFEREALLTAICDDMCGLKYTGVCENCKVIALIANAPSVDVVPVVHGRWIHDGCRVKGGIDWCHCSECGKSDNFCARTNYCPKCGAKMDGGDGDAVNQR